VRGPRALRPGQRHAEEDCTFTVRAAGFTPERAAKRCVEWLRRTSEAGAGVGPTRHGGAAR
jgi:hypothetical protein